MRKKERPDQFASERLTWGVSAASPGVGVTLTAVAILLTASLALAVPLSINFAKGLELEPIPLKAAH